MSATVADPPPTVRHRVSVAEGLRHLIDASKAVLSVLEMDRLLEVLMDQAVQLTRADRGFLMLADQRGELGFRIGRCFDRALLGEEPISRSVAEDVFRNRKPILSSDALGELNSRQSVRDLRLVTVMCVPLIVKETILGVLYLDSHHVRTAFDETSLAVLRSLADMAAIALENARLYELATTDPKTGLGNAGSLRTRLDRAAAENRRTGQRFALILIDLDHFKRVNDTHGHPAGDGVLQDVARILRSSVRSDDLAARFGGEEFSLLVSPRLPREPGFDPEATAERVRQAIADFRFAIPDGDPIHVTASLGVAEMGVDARDPEGLVAIADRRLYTAKRGGRNRVVGRAEPVPT